MLIQLLDRYEENQEENAKYIVKKICDIFTLLSNDGMNYRNIFNINLKLKTYVIYNYIY